MKNYGEYLRETVQSLVQLGGVANLIEICDDIEKRGNLKYINSNANWREIVKETIHRHCALSSKFSGNRDLFYPIGSLKTTFWTLTSTRDSNRAIVPDQDCLLMKDIVEMFEMNKTQQITLMKLMIGKVLFRNRIKSRYGKCVITGEENDRLLVATRIIPGHECTPANMLSANNGLLLTTCCDRLFTSGMISFREDMSILVSRELPRDIVTKLNIDFDKIYLENVNDELRENIRFHRDHIFKE